MSSSKGSDGGFFLLYSGVCKSISGGKRSNDESEPDIKDCAFADDDTEYAEDMMKVNNEEECNFMGENWEWKNWAPHDILQEIPDPKIEDEYNGPHGLED
eukprot:3219625-Ditylum_brightwellii.AAC.1